jgi:hypothetical protein
MWLRYATIAAVLISGMTIPAQAALKIGDFTGGVLFPTGVGNIFYGMNRNDAPFNLVTGSVVFDDSQVPGPGSGFVNVAIPIDTADAFAFAAGTQLSIDRADLAPGGLAMIQYNNGAFNGVVFTHDFAFEGSNYELSIAGGTWTIYDTATFQTRASGFINIGANGLTNIRPYATGPAVPEPATWAMMIGGFGLLGAAARRRTRVSLSYT